MSFHNSCQEIKLSHENNSSVLTCRASDGQGNMIPSRIRLDDHIGNSDGWFIWGGVNFTGSAQNVALENTDRGPKLTADLSMTNGGHRGRQGLFLSDKIENQRGHLKFLGA